jgi:hypothetical protein
MMPQPRLHRSSRERLVVAFLSLTLIVAGVGLLAVLPGCSPSAPKPASSTKGTPAATYTARGKIASLPTASSDMYLQHEAIPTFKDKDGKVVGMGTMTMPFPLAKGVTTDGLAVGDGVEFEFSVWWQPRVSYEVTRITKLPPGTTLDFGPQTLPTVDGNH